MTGVRAGVLLALTLAAGLAVGMPKDQNGLGFKVPPGWTLAHAEDVQGGSILELVKEGDTIDDWKELITIQNLLKPKGVRNPEGFFSAIKASREQYCPGVTSWHVIQQSESEITYEWSTSGPCMGQPAQSELARVLWNKRDFWVFHYAAKVKELPKDDRDRWLQWLSQLDLTGKR